MSGAGAAELPGRARIAACILNYQTPDLVEDCLASLLPELAPGRDAVLVVDNASGDGSVERLQASLDRSSGVASQLIESGRNGGFAAGHNCGIRSVEADAYLLLNSDILLRPGSVEGLWKALHDSPDVGLCSPRLEWPDGTPQISCFRFLSPWSELENAAGTGPVSRLLSRWTVSLPIAEGPAEPDWTSFAAVLIRREVIEQVGPLDEGFFMYFEDVDYCRRVRAAGWTIRHEPSARMVHLRGGSSPVKALTRARRRRPRYYYESRARYFRHAYGSLGPFLANAAWSAGRTISWAREVLGGRHRHTVEREWLDNWLA